MYNPEGKKIFLIVDDVELNRAIINEVFKNDYAILEAENGVEAVKLMEQHHSSISIVLLDIIMPVMDGFEVMRIMNERGWINKLPVVMITTDTSEESVQKGYDLSASDIISKPFNPKLVRQRVNNIVELYAHKSSLESMVEQQMNVLKSQSEKLHESTVNMIDMLSNVIGFKTCDAGPSAVNFREITKLILTELMNKKPEYNLSKAQIDQISEGALLHDIGKVAVPDAILNKAGRLNDEELAEAQLHAVRGGELIKQIVGGKKRDYFRYCYEICRYHHERFDGNGYPDKIAGNKIPIWAQVVSIVDVYDALVNKRSYRDAYTHSHAVAMIKNGECGQFNPDLLNAFLAVESSFYKEYPKVIESDEKYRNLANTINDTNNNEDIATDRMLWLLEMERRKYQMLSELSGDIIFEYSTKNMHVTFSENLTEITGIKVANENAGNLIRTTEALFDEDREDLLNYFRNVTPENINFKTEVRIKHKNDKYKWYEIFVHSMWDMENGVLIGNIIGKLVNIDRQKRETEAWRKAADTDSLTKLLNKAAVKNRIVEVIESLDSAESAFCFVDLDNFKMVNDTFGHQFGDEVLKKVAAELKNAVRLTDIVGRIGGDEFIIFLRGIGSIANIESKAAQIASLLQMDYGNCKISGSVGIARYPHDADNYDDLLYKSDKALYFMKTDGKNGYVFYDKKFEGNDYISKITDFEEK